MDFLKYDTKHKLITQVKYDRRVTAKTESIFSLGNGYMGLRSVDEEYSKVNKEDFFVNGMFNRENKDDVPELANHANLIQNPIFFNGIEFQVSAKDKYEKTLHIKEGFLSRRVKAKRDSGEFLIETERFVSQDNKNVYGQKIKIEILSTKEDQDVEVVLEPMINGQVTNTGTQHFAEGEKRRVTTESLSMSQKTNGSKRLAVHNLITKVFHNGVELKGGNDDYVVAMSRRLIKFKIKVKAKPGDVIVLEKLMSVSTSVDSKNATMKDEEVQEAAQNLHSMLLASNYETLKIASVKAMKKVWESFFVEIEGDESSKYDQLALEFGIFHLNNFVPKDSKYKNVGAKGLSGEGYQGHTYWDTEFFINPNYLFTDPEVARNLLVYRYKGIKGARAKAKEVKLRPEESNLEGAQYPWEMAWPTDGEVCPYWGQADVVTGEQVPIASRRQEIHVSADVAFAVNQYYQITQDEVFMEKYGYEMIIDTAWFYTNRAEIQSDGSFEIKDVMGPNEYKGNIDNNAYINQMAKFNIDLGIKVFEDLKENNPRLLDEIKRKLPYPVSITKMKKVSEGIKLQKPNKELIVAENDQFLGLPLIDVKPFQMLYDAGKKLFSTAEGHKRLCSQLVKQADVVLLMQVMPHLFTKEVRDANFDYYEKITTHDSSLSAASYMIEASRLRKVERAYELFKYGIDIDMGPLMHTSDAGIHAGSLAAIWQMLVFGFGGLTWFNDQLDVSPVLPENYKKLTYRVQYRGVWIEVEVRPTEFVARTISQHKTLDLLVNGKPTTLTNIKATFEVVR
ncbi:glycosyl hydrolase family 65 protein [Mycoplasma sp. Ms02]|uniref:glycosyl hydrolase family 65 protein n=1 Tax=Mycoplasma sp. Ms02 TaxID=353851 RepID=UPI001C88EEBD|nr:glycosyl hydrolase family 65 protein [Mycoplasma sp. Ms02]QZE12623.1 glycoside hydrolase family 65 protein [Mycoplasma sp. Ms02]